MTDVEIQSAKKGDRFMAPGWFGTPQVFVLVTRASAAAGWVDIRAHTWAVSWSKRMPAGVPASWERRDWTAADIEATTPP